MKARLLALISGWWHAAPGSRSPAWGSGRVFLLEFPSAASHGEFVWAGRAVMLVFAVVGGLRAGIPDASAASMRVDPLFAPVVSIAKGFGSLSLHPVGSDGSVIISGSVFSVGGKLMHGEGVLRIHPDGRVERDVAVAGVPRFLLVDGSYLVSGSEPVPGSSPTRYYLRRYSAAGELDPILRLDLTPATWTGAGLAPGGKLVFSNMARDAQMVAISPVVRVNADGSPDSGFACAIADPVEQIAVDGEGRILTFAGTANPMTRFRLLNPNGSVDPGFSLVMPSGSINRILAMADGSFLLFGRTLSLNGITRYGYARVLPSGTVTDNYTGLPDSGFSFIDARLLDDGRLVLLAMRSGSETGIRVVSVPADGGVPVVTTHAVTISPYGEGVSGAITTDGSSLVVGGIVGLGSGRDSRSTQGVLRFLPDGSVDEGFRAVLGNPGQVFRVTALSGGRTLLAGVFDAVNGVPMPGVAILRPDGSLDETFVPESDPFATVTDGVGLADGSVVLGGSFSNPTNPFGPSLSAIRLRADGSRDAGFDQHFPESFTAPLALGTTHDGQLLVSRASALDSRPPGARLTRFKADLTLDTGFDVVYVPLSSVRLWPMPDGSFFVSGASSVTDASGTMRTGVVRIDENGLFSPVFNPPDLSAVASVMTGPGGIVMVSGNFTSLGGLPRNGIARLLNDGSVDPVFVPLVSRPSALAVAADGSVIFTSGPIDQKRVQRLDREGRVDGALSLLVTGYKDSQPTSGAARANGDVILGGYFTTVEQQTRVGAFRITPNAFQAHARPARIEIPEGGTAFVSLEVFGAGMLEARWFRDDVPLGGADRRVLALRNVTAADAGRYVAEVTSGGSSVRTEPVEVVLVDATRVENLGTLTFSGAGGVGAVFINAPTGAPWSPAGLPDWLRVQPGASSGSGSFSFALTRNETGMLRTAMIEIAGESFEISQTSVSSRLLNISTRGRAGVGDRILIAGFVTVGTAPTRVLSRGVGPTLEQSFGLTGVLPDPALRLFHEGDLLDSNTDWEAGADRDEIEREGARVGAFDLASQAGDAGLLSMLPPGGYTVQVTDAAGRSGVVLAELYDLAPDQELPRDSRLVNISTRGWVGSGDDMLIAGFVIAGPTAKQVLVRGAGPSLAAAGVPDVLKDPHLRLVRNGVTLAVNDDWSHSISAGLIATATIVTGAFDFELDSREAAMVLTLAPGAYTAILSGADGGEGIGLVEVYDVE